MNRPEHVVLLMQSVHQHMVLEEILDRLKIRYRTVVKPRQLGSDCGMAMRIDTADLDRIRQICEHEKLLVFGVFFLVDNRWEPYLG
ncbi:DUF3343 domain-containing protein [bacterium]|nr:DUF3343 domain-containing protein [candidate division CSSED10-310 bacterium]